MNQAREICPGVYWTGVKNPDLQVFDELFPTRQGTTYNAYLVKGKDKTALIDTVKEEFSDEYFDILSSLIGTEKIDLVVVNHTEPDHTGALEELVRRHPEIEIYCTRAADNFLKQLIDIPLKTQVVAEGDEIDLGGRTLRFILAPNLHWPDTMFTYLPEGEILFSCDAFGAHFCGDGLYDDEVGDFSGEYRFYFDTIMRPFKEKIREAVSKVVSLPIRLVCPSHGPLRRQGAKESIDGYARMAAPPADEGLRALTLTLSPHGNTRTMAAAVRRGLEEFGIKVVELALYEAKEGEIRDELEQADALLMATPTINRDAPPPVWKALSLLSTVTPRGKVAGVFGSYGWSGEAVKLVEDRLAGLKYTLPEEGIHFRFKPTEADVQACQEFGRKIGRYLIEHHKTD